ncbi:MAG: hypothetical protein ACRC4W_02295 [Treponemataceae bacterium]
MGVILAERCKTCKNDYLSEKKLTIEQLRVGLKVCDVCKMKGYALYEKKEEIENERHQ